MAKSLMQYMVNMPIEGPPWYIMAQWCDDNLGGIDSDRYANYYEYGMKCQVYYFKNYDDMNWFKLVWL